jgi:hypothetical protein
MLRASVEPGQTGLGRRIGAVALAVALFLASPLIAVAHAAAQPVTAGDRMRAVFVAPDRKIDTMHQAVSTATTPIPPQELQSTSEPAPPKQAVTSADGPRLWVRRRPKPLGRR